MLFRKEEKQEAPPFDAQAFEQRLMNQVGQLINSSLSPVVAALDTLSRTRQGQQQELNDDDDDSSSDQQRNLQNLTPAQVRQMIKEAQESNQQNGNQFVPKSRQVGEKLFRKALTDEGRAMFDKYGDEVDMFIDNLPPEQQSNPKAWEQAFKFTMINNHEQEYVQSLLVDAKQEDLPPHLQTPGGNGGGTSEQEVDLTEDEKEVMGLFNSGKHNAKRFTPKEMKDYRDINPGMRLTMDQMIANAREKGLLPNGQTNGAKTEAGNNA